MNTKSTNSSLQRMSSNPNDLPIYYWRLALDILTNICVISFLIHAASVSLIRFNLYPVTFCAWITRCTISVYHITRCTLYAILVIRVYIGFSNSVYSYSRRYLIYPLFILIILWFITALSFDIISDLIHGEYNTEYQHCAPIFKSYIVVLISGIFDVLFCTILLILFIRPLIKLNRGIKRDQHLERLSTRQFTMDVSKTNPKTLNVRKPKTTDSGHSTRNSNSCHSSNNTEIELCMTAGINTVNINVKPMNLHAHTSTSSNISNVSNISNTSISSYTPNISSEFEIGTIKLQISEEITEIHENKQMDLFTEDIPQWMDNPSFTNNNTNSINYEIKPKKNKVLSKSLSYQKNLNEVYEELVTRYANLVVLCIGSSFILYLGVLMFGHWIVDLVPIDDAINVWCIVLIGNKTNKIYHKLCFTCDYLMKLCCKITMNCGLMLKNNVENVSVSIKKCDSVPTKSITDI